MRYKIFEIETKSKSVERILHREIVDYHRLKDLDNRPPGMKTTLDYLPEAYLEIEKFAADLKSRTLTILPIIKIDYDGQL
jgi:hypothetical protein